MHKIEREPVTIDQGSVKINFFEDTDRETTMTQLKAILLKIIWYSITDVNNAILNISRVDHNNIADATPLELLLLELQTIVQSIYKKAHTLGEVDAIESWFNALIDSDTRFVASSYDLSHFILVTCYNPAKSRVKLNS